MGQVSLNNLTFQEVAANGKSVQEMWLNGSQIYSAGDLWYGVRFSSSSPDGVRTGNMAYHKTLPVQSQFRGCGLSNGSVVGYLKSDDWTKYENNQAVDFNAVDIMVELPDAYYTVVEHGDYDWEIRMSTYAIPGYTKFNKQYVSAYEAYSDGTTLFSRKNQTPTVSKNRITFLAEARKNRNNHYAIYTYNAHKFITWCFVVEYATLNSQKAINNVLTAEGYHQGGLGNGVTTGTKKVNGKDVYSFVPCGSTDGLGNGSGEFTYNYINTDAKGAETQANVKANRYRGIENPFGHVWKNCCDIIITGTTNKVYLTDNIENFSNDKSLFTDSGLTSFPTTEQLVKRINNNAKADLFCQEGGASSNTYFCDHYWTNAIDSDRTLLLGACPGYGSAAGLFGLSSSGGVGCAGADVGTRLVYIP